MVAALAHLKDPNDRNNNLQYLECLSAALTDMAHTYQPAERMSIVLEAVLGELRGYPPTSAAFKQPKGVIPARRGSSTIDAQGGERPTFKRRVTATARSQSKASISSRSGLRRESMSMADVSMAGVQDHSHRRKQSDVDGDRPGEGFVMVTPRSEFSSSWPHNVPETAIDPSLSSGSTISTNSLATPNSRASVAPNSAATNNIASNAWMGSTEFAHDISALASVHFPEIRDFPGLSEDNPNSHLDFLTLGDGTDGWNKWHGGENGLGDLEGFPQPSFNTPFEGNTPGKW